MNMRKFTAALMTLVLLLPSATVAGATEPIVSTDWLQKNLDNPKVAILDIRKGQEYAKGHVPNAVNFFYNYWAIEKDGRKNEIPSDADLRKLVGSLGAVENTTVVVVGKTDMPVDRFNVTRVAWTLKYAGVQNVSVLNGGFNLWTSEKRKTSSKPKRGKRVLYDAPFNRAIHANKARVMVSLGKAIIVDAREEASFTGEKKLDFVAKPGHIQGAVNLPSNQMFTEPGTFKSLDELAAMATSALGTDKNGDIIVYCDSGRVATGWWFILHEALGYKNVRLYDGSAQDWTADPSGPLEP